MIFHSYLVTLTFSINRVNEPLSNRNNATKKESGFMVFLDGETKRPFWIHKSKESI